MNNKNYFIFAAAIALASCSVDEYMGENPEFTQTTKENIIGFGGGTGSMSRVTQNTGTTEQMLDNQFKVYGWKTVKVGETTTTQKVFDNYWVWYEDANTTSNPDPTGGADNADKGWEYVGNAGTEMPFAKPNDSSTKETLQRTQYIKYWDYSATDYKFVAGSPISAFKFIPSAEAAADIVSATVTGLGGHIEPNPTGEANKPAPVYIAEPVIIKNDNTTTQKYGGAVNLQFTRLQTKVRVGIYETIPGYKIKSIEFYENESTNTPNSNNNVILYSSENNYFVGGSNITGTVTYIWKTATPSYTFKYNDEELKKEPKWYGGKFAKGIKAISSNPTGGSSDISDLYGEDKDMDNQTGYFIVLPTPSATNASALTLKCKYILLSEDKSGEEITVTGATAAIPAAYCKWEPNKMYTYIFKISQETNGTTGTPGEDESGLFPITFDAAVIAETEAQQGTETIINAPSITTYQANSVTTNGIEYKTGTAIDITVMQDGNLQTLNSSDNTVGCVKVYNLGETNAKTEAELTVEDPTGTTVTVDLGKLNDSDENNNKASFKPTTAGYYAIQYCYDTTNGAAYKYKVIQVVSGS